MEQIDTAVIGAGVVGLAAALAIAQRGRSVCVLEREPRPGIGTSTHNSQVIHAGIYYPAGSLKASTASNGARMLYEFCAAHHVPHRRCGKLIVAHDDREVDALETLRARATRNGVEGLRLVDAAFIRDARAARRGARGAVLAEHRHPRRRGARADAGAALCADEDVALLPGTPLTGATSAADGDRAAHAGGVDPGAHRSSTPPACTQTRCRRLLGGEPFRIYPCRGEYVELVPAKRALVNGLVYPAAPHRTASAST